MSVPRLALTPGEPAGIGPDLVVQLVQEPFPAELVVVSDPDLLEARARQLGLPLRRFRRGRDGYGRNQADAGDLTWHV